MDDQTNAATTNDVRPDGYLVSSKSGHTNVFLTESRAQAEAKFGGGEYVPLYRNGLDNVTQRLANFGAWALRTWHNNGERGDLDGAAIEEAAGECGLLDTIPVPADGCGPTCVCLDCGAEPGDECKSIKEEVWKRVQKQP